MTTVVGLPTEPLLVRVARPYEHAAMKYATAGWSPIPTWLVVVKGKKSPVPRSGTTGYDGVDIDQSMVLGLLAECGGHDIALRLPPGVIGVDVDAYGSKQGAGTLATWEGELGPLPPTVISTSRTDGVSGIRLYRVPEGTGKLLGDLGPGSDVEIVQRHHRFVACWPTWKSKDGHEASYRWLHPDGRPVDTVPTVDELPMLPAAWVAALLKPVKTTTGKPPNGLPAKQQNSTEGIGAQWLAGLPSEPMCAAVAGELDQILTASELGENTRHWLTVEPVWRLVSMAREGHEGVGAALDTLHGELLTVKPEAEAEWQRGLDGAVEKATGNYPEWQCLCHLFDYLLDAADAESDFWSTRPVLTYLHAFARSRLVSPWAMLGVILCRLAVTVPPWVQLPPLIGGYGSLNLFLAVIGASGDGKGAAEGAASDALDLGTFEDHPPGSGEGIAHVFGHRDKGKMIRDQYEALFSYSEVDQLTALGTRQGSTILAILRSLWSGEKLGTITADPTRRVTIPSHTYRAALVVGVQPDRAGPLLDDASGGLPQRFVWLPGTDPSAPDDTPDEPESFPLERVVWKQPKASARFVMTVPDEVAHTIRSARLARLRGEGEALDGHSLFTREKVAAAFAVLDGRQALNVEDWRLAGVLLEVSDRTRAAVVTHLAWQTRNDNVARGQAEGARAAVAQDTAEDYAEKRVAQRLLTKLLEIGPTARGDLRTSRTSRDRKHFDGAVDRLVAAGDITVETTDHGERLVPVKRP